MPLESYEELRNVDIKKYCKKRDGLDYLNWATCINLLRMHGADNICKREYIPMQRKDFQGYRRKVIEEYNRLMTLLGRPII